MAPPTPPPVAQPNAATLKMIYAALIGLCGSANIGLAALIGGGDYAYFAMGFGLVGVFQKVGAVAMYFDAQRGR